MRVVLINHNVHESRGTYFRVKQVARHLALGGHQATLVTTSESSRWSMSRFSRDGYEVVLSPSLLSGRLRAGFDLLDTARRIGWAAGGDLGSVDVIHAFDSRPTVIFPALALRRRSGAPLILDWADWWGRGGTIEERPHHPITRAVLRPIETFLEEAFRTRVDYTTVVSEALRGRAAGMGIPPERIVKLGHGCETDQSARSDVAACRSEMGLPAGIPLLGYLGAVLQPDAVLLVRAIREIRTRMPEAQLLLLGRPGAEIPDEPGIIRTGFISDDQLHAYLGACDVLLLPLTDSIANRGRFPGKINSYLLAGKPIVVTPVGEAAAIVNEHRVGRVGGFEDGTFVDASVALLKDPEARRLLGLRARQVAEADLSWTSVIKPFIQLYETVATTRRQDAPNAPSDVK